MTVGQIVDYVITYNEMMQVDGDDQNESRKVKASQADWDAFLGR